MRVSVALATYNGSRYLQDQLDSFVDQARRPDELVVSDDGSTDATLAIIERFARSAPFPVRVFKAGRKLGFADNFLFAASQCRNEMIAFSDQDDVWRPEKLAVGLRRLMEDDSLLSLHRLELTNHNLRPIGYVDQEIAADAVFEPLQLDPYTTGWGNTLLFRRTLLDLIPRERRPAHPGLDQPLSHDTWIYVLAAALGRVSHIHQPLILYRQHGGNAVGKAAVTWRTRAADMLRDPTQGYREKVAVDRVLARLFDELAQREEGGLGERATRAAERYGLRAALFEQRAATYLAPSLSGRLRAYRSMLAASRADGDAQRRRKQAAVKDLVLGVTGLVRHTRRARS